MVLVWRITDDLPNLPMFPLAKISLHTVYKLYAYPVQSKNLKGS